MFLESTVFIWTTLTKDFVNTHQCGRKFIRKKSVLRFLTTWLNQLIENHEYFNFNECFIRFNWVIFQTKITNTNKLNMAQIKLFLLPNVTQQTYNIFQTLLDSLLHNVPFNQSDYQINRVFQLKCNFWNVFDSRWYSNHVHRKIKGSFNGESELKFNWTSCLRFNGTEAVLTLPNTDKAKQK